MDDWLTRYPSTTVTRTHRGDINYAEKFRGEGERLLLELRKQMSFNSLGQLRMSRQFTDGTTITVSSYINSITKVSKDFINIDVSKSSIGGRGRPSCTITFVDIPLSVPPMDGPGDTFPSEIVNVDYFKTYYFVDIQNCPTCQDIVWDFLFDYAIPVEPRHYHNPWPIPQMGVPPGGDDPNNHTVYSLYPACFGEIISHDHDAGGSYIIWKAYTEAASANIFSRTGLGIMLLTAEISDLVGNVICNQQAKIDVDCCKKDSDSRNVEIWWEGVGTCEPFIIYNDKHICLMPATVSTRMLITYSTPFYAAQPLYAIPDIKGSCIPLEWTFSGPIIPINTGPYGTATYFQITSAPGDCESPVTITLMDRCGKSYIVNATPCCTDADPLVLNYTSLLMSCSQQQYLFATGGCGPYSWSITGGGGTLSAVTGENVTYTAPSTNPNCTSNPTITVTDCCGNTASISLAVNCYSDGSSLVQTILTWQCPVDQVHCFGGVGCSGFPPGFVCAGAIFDIISYDCSGVMISECNTGDTGVYYWCYADCSPLTNCFTAECGCGGASPCPCNSLIDMRTSAMKEGGCCPLNPITGLPY